MSEAEADRVLDGPPRNDLGHAAIIWLPQAEGSPISAWVDPAASKARSSFVREFVPVGGRLGRNASPDDDFFPEVSSKRGRQKVWVTRTGLVAVYFGEDGRLRHTYFSDVHESAPPSFIDWVASRPAMIRRSLGY